MDEPGNGDGNSAPTSVPMRAGRNGGKLRTGNPNSAGRMPAVVRAACLAAFHERVPMLTEIADQRDPKGESYAYEPIERIKAIEVLARYGLGPPRGVDLDDVKDRVGKTWDLMAAQLPAKRAADLLPQFRAIWSG